MGKHIQTRDSRGLRCPLWQIIGRVRDNRHLVEQLLYRYRNGEEIPHFAGLSSERRSVLFLPLTWICICIFWRHWRGRKCGVDMICSARRCCRFNFTFSRDTRLAAKRAPPISPTGRSSVFVLLSGLIVEDIGPLVLSLPFCSGLLSTIH